MSERKGPLLLNEDCGAAAPHDPHIFWAGEEREDIGFCAGYPSLPCTGCGGAPGHLPGCPKSIDGLSPVGPGFDGVHGGEFGGDPTRRLNTDGPEGGPNRKADGPASSEAGLNAPSGPSPVDAGVVSLNTEADSATLRPFCSRCNVVGHHEGNCPGSHPDVTSASTYCAEHGHGDTVTIGICPTCMTQVEGEDGYYTPPSTPSAGSTALRAAANAVYQEANRGLNPKLTDRMKELGIVLGWRLPSAVSNGIEGAADGM